MSALTWLGIVVAGILLLTAYKGFRRGFIREIVSFFFVFLAPFFIWCKTILYCFLIHNWLQYFFHKIAIHVNLFTINTHCIYNKMKMHVFCIGMNRINNLIHWKYLFQHFLQQQH